MCVYDESLTMACQMYEGWLRETGKLESLGQHRYLPGEPISLALYLSIYHVRYLNLIITRISSPAQYLT